MRHRLFGKQLGRNHNQRQALLKNLVKSVFDHGSIKTTYAKTQAVISLVEKLSHAITCRPETFAKDELAKIFQSRKRVNEIYSTFKTTFSDQTSNFTKVVKIKRRIGDDALIVKLSFVKPYVSKPVKIEEKKSAKKEDKKPVKNKKIIKK